MNYLAELIKEQLSKDSLLENLNRDLFLLPETIDMYLYAERLEKGSFELKRQEITAKIRLFKANEGLTEVKTRFSSESGLIYTQAIRFYSSDEAEDFFYMFKSHSAWTSLEERSNKTAKSNDGKYIVSLMYPELDICSTITGCTFYLKYK